MKKLIIYSSIALFCGLFPLSAKAQDFAIKAYGDIGFGNAMSITTSFPSMTTKSSSNDFGIDFGYSFWRKNANSLEVNIGIGYRMATSKFNIAEMSYSYGAPASADVDGNPYQRYTSLSDVDQKIDMGFVNIPIYLQYQYRATNWLGIHADFGFGLGLKCSGKIGSTGGSAYSYGVYPEYGDLVIDANYLNDFGHREIANATPGEPEIQGFSASILAGAGLEFYVGGPVSIDLGVRYNAGLTNTFSNKYDIGSSSTINAENAPLTYTVANGQQVKALSDYLTKSRLNPFCLHLGINLRF